MWPTSLPSRCVWETKWIFPLSSTSSPVQSPDLIASSGIVVLVAAHRGGLMRLSQTNATASAPSAHAMNRVIVSVLGILELPPLGLENAATLAGSGYGPHRPHGASLATFSESRLGEVRPQTLGPDPNWPASRHTPGHRNDPMGLAARWDRHVR